ncbi:hypothetical protein AMTRI_Chr06g178870 [Amborella trichopoda]|uniref:Uncharacterized protein n=1 Tax=Amborella trichopoda TaxID=13333 RepID=U5D3L4_AMBTC|nr:hypothetical protein AMTR_s00066p00111540 [Amborella trichopoda]
MEGLIPFVFKAIKNNRSRRKYHCLSERSTGKFSHIEIPANGNGFMTPQPEKYPGIYVDKGQLRRQKSAFPALGFSGTNFSPENSRKAVGFLTGPASKSHRLFLCVTGG